ncbi:MAG TPA: hypothetical protein VKR06_32155 [Ktedonosporobacter sp.]|nr:hypothetical protein [Ktedonosporobacter sp.]
MRFSAIFSEQAARRLGVAASALLLCGVTLIGSTGAGMMDRSQANPTNHTVVRPHHPGHGHGGHGNSSHGNGHGNSSHGSSGSNGSSSSSKSSVKAVVLPLTGSDPGSHRLP